MKRHFPQENNKETWAGCPSTDSNLAEAKMIPFKLRHNREIVTIFMLIAVGFLSS